MWSEMIRDSEHAFQPWSELIKKINITKNPEREVFLGDCFFLSIKIEKPWRLITKISRLVLYQAGPTAP